MASSVKEKITCHMTAILKALDCAICLSIIKCPVSMGCGHFFCRLCIVEVLKSNYRTPCPLCKRSFTRRSIENADQRNSIVLAAGKLALECGKLTGANIVSPDTLNLFNDLDIASCSSTTSLNEAKEEPKPSKSRKRKSQENDVCEKVSSSRPCVSNTEGKILVPDTFPANGEVLQESNKRQCQQSSQSDEEFELPSLDEIIASARISNSENQQENNDKLDVQEKRLSSGSNRKSLKVSFADTPVVSCKTISSSNCRVSNNAKESNKAIDNEEPERNENNKEIATMQSKKLKTSKLRESIQNKKNALKNKTNQIISNGNENIMKKTPGRKKIVINDSTKSPDDEKAKENISRKVTQNEDTNVTSSVAMSPKSSNKERSKMKPGISRSNKTEQEALISKLNAAENFTLCVVNTRQTLNPTSMTVPEECYSLNETNLPNLRENAGDCPMDAAQLCQKEQSLITDTAVSVQSVVSPTANKLETLSKSPGWSKVRQVGKDFRVKKFSKLQVEKNSSNSCPMESDVLENSSEGSPCEMPKLIKITELEREAADKNSKNAECVSMNNKSDCKRGSLGKNKKSSGKSGSSLQITAEIHSQELCNSYSKEDESIDKNKGNEYLSNYDESETSIVMNTMEKTLSSSSDKSIFSNQNTSNRTKKVSDESIVNFNGSFIPSPDMPSMKPNVTKVLHLATDIRNSSAEIEFLNEDEFQKNLQTTLPDTYDSHMVENDMDIDENDDHILPVHDTGVEPYKKQMIGKVSGLEMYSKQKFQKLPLNVSSRETESTKLSPKFRSVSKSLTTGTKTLFTGDETVYFASHSQQTSQRLFCGDNASRHNGTLSPAFGLFRHTIPSFGNENVQNQIAMFNKSSSPEKTKVLKRTCLTLEEIQDAFSKCSNERPVTICSLPFSSGEYRLDINVADETLNISVLKIDSFERPKETVERTLMFAEKNIQTSDFLPPPLSVLPSSNTESECSQPDNNATKPMKNLFPYLNQYFSDSDPSQQCNILAEENEDRLEVSEVIPYCKPDSNCDPQQEPEETTRVVESMKTLLSELQALPTKDFSLSDVCIVTESLSVYDEVEEDVEPLRNSKELAEALPTKDLGPSERMTENQTVCETGGNIIRKTLKQSNELVISCVTKKADESLQYDDLPPTQVAFGDRDNLAANKTKHNTSSKDFCSQEESTYSFEKQKGEGYQSLKNNSSNLKKLKGTECDNQLESGKKNSSSLSQRLRTISSTFNSVNKSHNLTLMEKYSTEETDPDLAMVNELVGPLKELAEELKASGKAAEETSLVGGERAGNQKRPLEIFEEMVLSKNHDSSGICPLSQRGSRLSLKSKGTPKKFKRIQRYSCSDDSDSDIEDIPEKIPSPKSIVLPTNSKENATSGSSSEHCTTHSFVSQDLTNGNTSDIAMEIESLDEKIKSVMTKLKDIGREDLLDCENGPDVSKLNEDLSIDDDNGAASDDSQKSTDIFSVPPTPPDALSSDLKTLKTSRWKN